VAKNLEELLAELARESRDDRIKVAFSRSLKPSVLASVRIELSVQGTGDTITIDGARVLRSKKGGLWLAMPDYSVPTNGERGYRYLPSVVLSAALREAVEDAVFLAFEAWERQQMKP